MSNGLPNETSVFENRSIESIYEEIREVYQRYPQPWVIGYSGGKDSTAVLQLVWEAIEGLPPNERQKKVFVVASDTGVEAPLIVDHIDNTLDQINETAKDRDLPFDAKKVGPTLKDSFWVNLIGRGYPAPTARFRWCTDRLKIKPANRFIEEKVTKYGEVIMILGVRKTESATRMQLMNSYQVKDHLLRRHASLQGAYVYAPIAEFSADDVWTYLLQSPSPWGGRNRDLAALYRNADSECPLVIDTSTPPCGNSRFGCWVCTVAERDASMEALIDSGEEWMEPLLEFRELLALTTDPEHKREFRDIRGRDGRVILKKDGEPAARTYKREVSKEMLERLLEIQKTIRENGPDTSVTLISVEELMEIRRIWRTERQDWDDSVPQIFRKINGYDLEWPVSDDGHFDAGHESLLASICEEYDVPFELIARMLEAERQRRGMARRAGIHEALADALSREWRSEAKILADESSHSQLVPSCNS
jgi:DNA sulfur modification protein DndC